MTVVLILPPLAILLYLTAAVLLARRVVRGMAVPQAFWALPTLALLAHLGTHAWSWLRAGAPDLHFLSALSLVGAGMAGLTLLMAVRGRMATLATIVLPIAALTLGLYARLGGERGVTALDWRLQLHAWSALLAYAALAVAALLAVMLWWQERALRERRVSVWLRALPPLIELETLLFRTIGFGFVLLSAALLTGALFVEDLLAQHLAHKTVFSALSWLAFGALLLGRWRRGWRGRTAVRWTLAAMSLLVLAYFGSRFVLEYVLHRV